MSSRELVSLGDVFPGLRKLVFTLGELSTEQCDGQLRFSLQLYHDGLPVAVVQTADDPTMGIEWDWLYDSYREEFGEFAQSMGFRSPDQFIASLIACRMNLSFFQHECQRYTLFRRASDPADSYQRIKKPLSHKLRQKITRSEKDQVFFYNDLFQEPTAGDR